MILDSHFHSVQMREKGLDPAAELLAAREQAGLSLALDICIELAELPACRKLAENLSLVWTAAGIYPSACVAPDLDLQLETLAAAARRPNSGSKPLLAIGEIGLDYHWNYGTPELQRALFLRQLELANSVGLPVIIHCRDAQEDLLACLRQTPPRRGGIIHCFSGSLEFARSCIDLGFRISFAGNLTYKKAEDLREVLRHVPQDCVLFETDSPFLAPQSLRGKLNTPANVAEVYTCAAATLQLPQAALEERVMQNFLELFPECREGSS